MENSSSARKDVPYILVHSDREIRRLKHQADIVNPITRRILVAAGIKPGMHVLDVGCGAGDVTLLISALVGEGGHVVGADRVPAALAAAETRAKTHPIRNISFREGDPATLSFEKPFDAVVGRYVLMFQPDPAAMLRGVARHARRDGIIAFHEPDWDGVRSHPQSESYDRCCRWIIETFRRAGIETHMGSKLDATFRRAGLAAPQMHLESVIGGEVGGIEWAHATAELVITMLPEIVNRGVASEMEVGPASLEGRIRRDIDAGSIIVGRAEIGAWASAPGA